MTIATIFFIAILMQSSFGFGSALVAMPLLSLVLDLKTASPLFALVALTINSVIVLQGWQAIDIQAVWRLVVATWIGIPLGVGMVAIAPTPWITTGLSLFLILFGLYRLIRWPLPTLKSSHWAYPFGICAGILGGAYNTNGPPIVLYGIMNHWPPQRFRATLQGYFLPTGIAIALTQGFSGLWTATVGQLYLTTIPSTIVALYCGQWINRHIHPQQFERGLSILLILLGGLLLYR
ncbi:sulfite exporter TauE/SafE family protein [Spirulina major]|uniref:sulfite exporter TauE/SafE family protein n=1 Tax=Spirulina major TaxID=270636 RepID=UPI000934ED33|nr:sulfite exporter TauE/SafE family protein [Spirulina major]